MQKIRIDEMPQGFAEEKIRKDWVGCEIPLATKEDLIKNPPSGLGVGFDNIGGYKVLKSEAIVALRNKGKKDAADFWESMLLGSYLVFKKDICTLL